jgi:hypothetical protein
MMVQQTLYLAGTFSHNRLKAPANAGVSLLHRMEERSTFSAIR